MIEENELMEQNNSVQLFEAVKSGNVGDVQKLIDAGAKVDAQDEEGDTPLHIAVYRNDIEMIIKMIEVLVKANKNIINIADYRGKTALLLTVDIFYILNKKDEYISVIRKLIEEGADIHAKDRDGMTALYCAGIGNDINGRLIETLLENGADPNIKMADGSYEIMHMFISSMHMSIKNRLSCDFFYMLAFYANNLDAELKQQIKTNERLRDRFETGERVRVYVDNILLGVQNQIELGKLKSNYGYNTALRNYIEERIKLDGLEELLSKKRTEWEDMFTRSHYLLCHYKLLRYIQEHVLIDGVRYTKKHVFVHNNKPLLDALSEVYDRKLKYILSYDKLVEFALECDKKVEEVINTKVFNFDISRLSPSTETLRQLAYVEFLRLLKNNSLVEVLYHFDEHIKTQKAILEEQIKKQTEVELPDNVIPSDEEGVGQPQQEPVVAEEDVHKGEDIEQPQEPIVEEVQPALAIEQPQEKPVAEEAHQETSFQKPKNNNKYYYIGVGAVIGLVVGLGIAFAAPATLAWIFVISAVLGAVAGSLVGYGVSKCLENPNVKIVEQPAVQLQQGF